MLLKQTVGWAYSHADMACRCVSPNPQTRPTARQVHDIIEGALQKHTSSLPLDSVLHDAVSTNLGPEPEPVATGRYRLRPDYRS